MKQKHFIMIYKNVQIKWHKAHDFVPFYFISLHARLHAFAVLLFLVVVFYTFHLFSKTFLARKILRKSNRSVVS